MREIDHLEIHTDPNLPAAEIYLRHLQTPTCVIVPQSEVIGSERVVNAHNIYMNSAAIRRLSAIYPNNDRTGRSTQELVLLRIQAITEDLPEFQMPTITFFSGNPDGKTILSQSGGISLGYAREERSIETTEKIIKGLFHIDD